MLGKEVSPKTGGMDGTVVLTNIARRASQRDGMLYPEKRTGCEINDFTRVFEHDPDAAPIRRRHDAKSPGIDREHDHAGPDQSNTIVAPLSGQAITFLYNNSPATHRSAPVSTYPTSSLAIRGCAHQRRSSPSQARIGLYC